MSARQRYIPNETEDIADVMASIYRSSSQVSSRHIRPRQIAKPVTNPVNASPEYRDQLRRYKLRQQLNQHAVATVQPSSDNVAAKHTGQQFLRRLAIGMCALVLLGGVSYGGYVAWQHRPANLLALLRPDASSAEPTSQSATPEPALSTATTASGPTSMYYPAKLTKGYIIEPTISEPTVGVKMYDILSDTGKKIYISQQRVPASINFNDYFSRWTSRSQLPANLGVATVGNIPTDTIIASIVAGQDWVIVSASKEVPFDAFTKIVKELRKESDIPVDTTASTLVKPNSQNNGVRNDVVPQSNSSTLTQSAASPQN